MTWVSVSDMPGEVGAVYLTDPVQLGYGESYVQARVNTLAQGNSAAGSWALILLADPPAEWLDDTGPRFPATPGIAVSWVFNHVVPPYTQDWIGVHELRSSGGHRIINTSSNVSPDQDGPAGTSVVQTIWVEIVTDDPRTAVDESALWVLGPLGTGLGCSNDGADPCGMSFVPGDLIHVGILALTESTNAVSVIEPRFSVTRHRACPGE